MNVEKRKQVYEVLLTPIICEKNKELRFQNGVIISPQDYYSKPDEDMCNFTVGFYNILYKNKIPEGVLLENGDFRDKEFAGDTMHTFKSVANLLMKGFYNDELNMEIPSIPYLDYYKAHYHCLANFWIIPMRHGRTSPKKIKGGKETYDFSEFYLQDVQANWESLRKQDKIQYVRQGRTRTYDNYFLKFESFVELCDTHFISFTEHNAPIKPEDLPDMAIESIRERARKIAFDKSDIPNRLWDYFNKLGLIDSMFGALQS